MSRPAIEWLAPSSLEDALKLRAAHGDEATVVAGGTFLGILMNQGFLTPPAMLSLGAVAELRGIEVTDDGGNPKLTRDDRRVRHRAARLGDQAADLGEEHDPRRVRHPAHEDVALADLVELIE